MKTEYSVVNEKFSTDSTTTDDVELKSDAKPLSKLRAIPNVMHSEEKPSSHVHHSIPVGLESEDEESECTKCGKFKEDIEHYENTWISCDNCAKWFHGW